MASPRGCHATMILLMASTLFVSCRPHRQLERQARQVKGQIWQIERQARQIIGQIWQLKGIPDRSNGDTERLVVRPRGYLM